MQMDNLMDKKTINVFSKDNCKYCNMLKEKLNEIEAYTKIINMSELEENEYNILVAELKEKTKHKTFPFVFINDKFYGGYTEINNKIIMGSLFDILDEQDIKYNKDIALF